MFTRVTEVNEQRADRARFVAGEETFVVSARAFSAGSFGEVCRGTYAYRTMTRDAVYKRPIRADPLALKNFARELMVHAAISCLRRQPIGDAGTRASNGRFVRIAKVPKIIAAFADVRDDAAQTYLGMETLDAIPWHRLSARAFIDSLRQIALLLELFQRGTVSYNGNALRAIEFMHQDLHYGNVLGRVRSARSAARDARARLVASSREGVKGAREALADAEQRARSVPDPDELEVAAYIIDFGKAQARFNGDATPFCADASELQPEFRAWYDLLYLCASFYGRVVAPAPIHRVVDAALVACEAIAARDRNPRVCAELARCRVAPQESYAFHAVYYYLNASAPAHDLYPRATSEERRAFAQFAPRPFLALLADLDKEDERYGVRMCAGVGPSPRAGFTGRTSPKGRARCARHHQA